MPLAKPKGGSRNNKTALPAYLGMSEDSFIGLKAVVERFPDHECFMLDVIIWVAWRKNQVADNQPILKKTASIGEIPGDCFF
jgi:hypothetical protein